VINLSHFTALTLLPFEAFVLVQYPSDHTIVQVIEHWLQAPTTYFSIIPDPTTNLGVQQICQILYPTLGFVIFQKTLIGGPTSIFIIAYTAHIEWMAPSFDGGVHPSHRSRNFGIRVSYTAVHNLSFQSLFTPIETIPYFFKRLQIFLGIGHPISENQCSHRNFQKDCVQSFPTCETYAVLLHLVSRGYYNPDARD